MTDQQLNAATAAAADDHDGANRQEPASPTTTITTTTSTSDGYQAPSAAKGDDSAPRILVTTSRQTVETAKEQERHQQLGRKVLSKFLARKLMKSNRKSSSAASSALRHKPQVNLEPTYRMEPKRSFPTIAVRQTVREMMQAEINNFSYSAKSAVATSKRLADQIKDRVKAMHADRGDRYKLIVIVTICEKLDENAVMGSRCLWNNTFDHVISETAPAAKSIFSSTVFASYTD